MEDGDGGIGEHGDGRLLTPPTDYSVCSAGLSECRRWWAADSWLDPLLKAAPLSPWGPAAVAALLRRYGTKRRDRGSTQKPVAPIAGVPRLRGFAYTGSADAAQARHSRHIYSRSAPSRPVAAHAWTGG